MVSPNAKLHGRGVQFGQTIKITKKVEKTLKNCENELVSTPSFWVPQLTIFQLRFPSQLKNRPHIDSAQSSALFYFPLQKCSFIRNEYDP